MTLRQAVPGRLLLACAAALLATTFLNACAAPGSGLQREAATQLQARVLEVTQASSQNDPAAALKALEGLEADLSAAQAKGQVSEERRRSITTVATAVRADLTEAVAAQAAAAKAAEDARVAAAQAAQDPSPAPASQAAPAPAPAQGSAAGNGADGGKNNGDKGKGKN
ncbi:hypothetical protein AB0280_14715 [Pseudarthrobacter sp902506025]|uniref:Mucin-associated surface protein n=1 Tax=Pseudarthrobacter defluvii TaxID=410837 RepID=A0ABT9UDT7_9MICC|nr:hypothetical protein [Pseudarthrobacter defluvii]MDQ0117823.1 hypothetical protein [Pseudarthrobacter defluvii]